jgi:hypothetical protein
LCRNIPHPGNITSSSVMVDPAGQFDPPYHPGGIRREPEQSLPSLKSKCEKSFDALVPQFHRFMQVLDLFQNSG